MKKILLIDLYPIAIRAYTKLKRTTGGFSTSDGKPTTMVYGFLSTLSKLLKMETFNNVIICSDTIFNFRKNFRPYYKASRGRSNRDSSEWLNLVNSIRGLGFPIVKCNGVEADDIVFSISRNPEYEFFIATNDKDLYQAVAENVSLILANKSKLTLVDKAMVCEEYGVESPSDVAKIKALMGDKSDEIPAIKKGVGLKTAQKLLYSKGIPPENVLQYKKSLGLTQLMFYSSVIPPNIEFNSQNVDGVESLLTSLEIKKLKAKNLCLNHIPT